MVIIGSTRFNNDTFLENEKYREEKNIICIYPVPQKMSIKIDNNELLFVVEMNNSLNRIEGIGLIRNVIQMDKIYKVYSDGNFNRYVYKSNYRLDRHKLIEYNEEIVFCLDYILFKEKTHLKRGIGITTIPEKLLNHKICNNIDLKKEIKNMFLFYYRNSL
jgi:hypothetical protein